MLAPPTPPTTLVYDFILPISVEDSQAKITCMYTATSNITHFVQNKYLLTSADPTNYHSNTSMWSWLSGDAGTRQSQLPQKWGTLVSRRLIQLWFDFIPTEWLYGRAVEFMLWLSLRMHVACLHTWTVPWTLIEITLIEERAILRLPGHFITASPRHWQKHSFGW